MKVEAIEERYRKALVDKLLWELRLAKGRFFKELSTSLKGQAELENYNGPGEFRLGGRSYTTWDEWSEAYADWRASMSAPDKDIIPRDKKGRFIKGKRSQSLPLKMFMQNSMKRTKGGKTTPLIGTLNKFKNNDVRGMLNTAFGAEAVTIDETTGTIEVDLFSGLGDSYDYTNYGPRRGAGPLLRKLKGDLEGGAAGTVGTVYSKLANIQRGGKNGPYRPVIEPFFHYWLKVFPKAALERAKKKVFKSG